MTSTSPHLKLLPISGSMPARAVAELENAKLNWASAYGSVARFVEYVPLGRIATDAERDAVLAWINSDSPILTGNLLAPKTLKAVAPSQLTATVEDRHAFEAKMDSLVAIGDIAIEIRWTDSDGSDFSTLTIACGTCCGGIKYDSVLSHALLSREIFIPPTEAETDTFHRDFGWIWQSKGSYTRGFVDFALTCIPTPPGCKWSEECKMNLGTCDVKILPDPPTKTGLCCTTTYAWGVATGTISVTVVIGATGALQATFSGVFGSTAEGAGSLVDCCPAPAVVPPATTPLPKTPPPPPQTPGPPPTEFGGGTITGQGENTVVKKPDGSTVVITPGGVTIVVKPDGSVVVLPVGGGEVPGGGDSAKPKGKGSTVTGQGHNTVVVTPNGTTVVIMPNGTTIVTKPGCDVVVIPPTGGMTPGTFSPDKKTCESEKQRTCKSLGDIYKYQSKEGALEGLENEWGFPCGTLRAKNRQVTTDPPCAGEGLHYDAVDDKGNKWGSITGCPCCLDTDAGPISTWRWAFHKRRNLATDDLPHPGGILTLPGDPGHPGTGTPTGPRSNCGDTFSIRSISTGDTEEEARRNARENADWAAKQRCPQNCPAVLIDWHDEGCSQHGSRWGCSGTGDYTCR